MSKANCHQDCHFIRLIFESRRLVTYLRDVAKHTGTSDLRSIITDFGIHISPHVFSGLLGDNSLTHKSRCAKYLDSSSSWKLEQLSPLSDIMLLQRYFPSAKVSTLATSICPARRTSQKYDRGYADRATQQEMCGDWRLCGGSDLGPPGRDCDGCYEEASERAVDDS